MKFSLKYLVLLVTNKWDHNATILKYSYDHEWNKFNEEFSKIDWVKFPFAELPEPIIRSILESFHFYKITFMWKDGNTNSQQ